MAGTPGSNEYESVVDDDEGEGILSHIQTDCTTYPGRESIDVVCGVLSSIVPTQFNLTPKR